MRPSTRVQTLAVLHEDSDRQLIPVGKLRNRTASLSDRILDLRYADLVADPVGQVERMNAHFDLPWAAPTRERLTRWMDAHPRHEHGTHRYSAELFGLDPAEVEALGAPYRERFDVPRDGGS